MCNDFWAMSGIRKGGHLKILILWVLLIDSTKGLCPKYDHWNRRQRVVLNGKCSNWAPIHSGVPQGSVLGPLLFLIYINDLECGIKSQIKFFADDTSLYSVVKDPITSAAELNHDLKIISEWANQWKMSFNPDPTKPAEEILFSQKKNPVVHPPLFFNGVEVKRVTEHKHLGLILDPLLNFAAHIKEKSAKARKGIGLIKHLKIIPTNRCINLNFHPSCVKPSWLLWLYLSLPWTPWKFYFSMISCQRFDITPF